MFVEEVVGPSLFLMFSFPRSVPGPPRARRRLHPGRVRLHALLRGGPPLGRLRLGRGARGQEGHRLHLRAEAVASR